MTSYEFHLVNVFAESHFGGNPLAVFPKADDLTDEQMQAIAKQFNLSETVFILAPSDDMAVADLRIFTPNYELPLAGHPTLGSAFILKQQGGLPDSFIVNTKAKPVTTYYDGSSVQIKLSGFNITQAQADKSLIANMSGLVADDIANSAHFVNSGTQQILIELTNRAALSNIRIDIHKLRKFNTDNPYATTLEPSVYYWLSDGDRVHSRMFFEQNGVMVEDSGTGSACANLGAYFIALNNYPISKTIHQGDDMGRSNRLSLHVDNEQHIYVGGNVVEVGRGEFYVPKTS